MTVFEFTQQIEESLETEVRKLLPGYWDEDLLTQNFLISLSSKFRNITLEDLNGISKVSMNAFKQAGTLTETKFGDIAIIVKITYPDGKEIEGVGYLEAKKRSFGTMRFGAINVSQLKKINKNAPRARLLLYDYTPIVGFIPTYCEESYFENGFERLLRFLPITYSVALPINVALKANHFDTDLYKYAIPFSQQFVYRYMYAHDLEFDDESISASKGFAKRQRLTKYVLTIEVGPSSKSDFDGVQVNQQIFERLLS